MAPIAQPHPGRLQHAQHTLSKLQTVNTGFENISDQICQAARIIGLPTDWDSLRGQSRTLAIRRIARNRADWVLKWILDKMQDASARANPTAWVLLDWMLHILPISRCAPHLREARFVTILEQTLQEAFGTEALARNEASSTDEIFSTSMLDSNQSTLEDTQSSGRKRKRGDANAALPKRVALRSSAPAEIFDAVFSVIQSLIQKSEGPDASDGLAQAELMKMVLKTECAQAARILRNWFIAVACLMSSDAAATSSRRLDLAPILQLWDLRTVDAESVSPASTEEFTSDCLIPTLVLLQTLRNANGLSDSNMDGKKSLKNAIGVLDKLLVGHVLAPARMAFISTASSQDHTGSPQTNPLSSNVTSLRATLLQAAQLEDTGDTVPPQLLALFTAVPHLLSLTIRSSPARSLRSKVSERPWIQAAFVALVECAGCTFEAPRFETTPASVQAVRDCLQVLSSHDISIELDVLKDLFWFHSGLQFPVGRARSIHWTLIESLVELDAEIFLADPRSTWHAVGNKPDDLSAYLFDQISRTDFEPAVTLEANKVDIDEKQGLKSYHRKGQNYDTSSVVRDIVVPIMAAYTRSRDLLGFIYRWDLQLSTRGGSETTRNTVWANQNLTRALSTQFEQSLTPAQISGLFEEYSKRLQSADKPKKGLNDQTFGSLVLVQAMLQSIRSDTIVDWLKSHLLTLWTTLRLWILDSISTTLTRSSLVWATLSELFILLWPTYLHASRSAQKEELYLLIKQASKIIASSNSASEMPGSAIAFMFTACGYLQSLPDTKEFAVKCVRRAFKSLSSTSKHGNHVGSILEIFCAEHVLLLEEFDDAAAKDIFAALLSAISRLNHNSGKRIMALLSESVYTHGNLSLQTSCTSALLAIISLDDEKMRNIVSTSFLRMVPSSIPREQRELVLNTFFGLLMSLTDTKDAGVMLSVMVSLMTVPNATAKLSSDGAALFELAQHLHERGMETPLVLLLIRNLTQLALSHILPNKDQVQNKCFLQVYASQVKEATKKARKCSPARLALLQGSFLASTKYTDLFPIEPYVAFLIACLGEDKIPKTQVLEAFNDIYSHALMSGTESFSNAQSTLRTWFSSLVPISDEFTSIEPEALKSFGTETWCTLHGVLGKYQLFTSHGNLVRFTCSLLAQRISSQQQMLILESFRDSLSHFSAGEKLNLLPACMPTADGHLADVTYRLLQVLISTMENRQESDAQLKQQQLSILPQLCLQLERGSSDVAFNVLLDSIVTIIRDKPALITQHSIECVIAALSNITSRRSPRLSTSHAPAIYTRICETVRLVLILHRSRLGGRFHALLPLLQSLLLCLFIPNTGRGAALPPWLDHFSTLSSSTRLTAGNAGSLTRLLSSLCSPTQSAVTRHSHHHPSKAQSKTKSDINGSKDLNDPIKAARDYTAQFAYPLLSSFCRFQLYGSLEASVRAELMPGIWEVISVASLERETLDAMFAGLGASESDVWRGVWRDWEVSTGRSRREDENGH